MEQESLVFVHRDILKQTLSTLERAKRFHQHAHEMKVAEGYRAGDLGSPLFEDIKDTLSMLENLLNPIPKEFDNIEG